MDCPIHATLTRCRHGQPLVVLDSEPFNGMEIRPDDLRRMAQRLARLADMAGQFPTGAKYFRPLTVQVDAEPAELTR